MFTEDKERHCILIKVLMEQEDIAIINMCKTKGRPSRHTEQKQAEWKEQMSFTITVADFIISLPMMNLPA